VIIQKSDDEIQRIAEACEIVSDVLNEIKNFVKPGISTLEIDSFAESLVHSRGAKPAFKGYRGFPSTLCTSINEEVVHGIPSSKVKLEEGDIISIDLGVFYKGFYGDAAYTIAIGKISEKTQRLLKVCRRALDKGIEKAVVGARLYDISHTIQSYVESCGYSVVRDFVGHGIGRSLHEDPQIPNYGKKGHGPRLKKGMTLAIEPMVNEGKWEVLILDNGWTAVTKDRCLSAHYEHTVAVTSHKPLILTKH
jgi:methionyl aminopeptidase